MNVANITDSRTTATFSALRRSQRATGRVRDIISELTDHAGGKMHWGEREPAARRQPARFWKLNRPAIGQRSLHRVDAFKRALRPVIAVFFDVPLLREGAE